VPPRTRFPAGNEAGRLARCCPSGAEVTDRLSWAPLAYGRPKDPERKRECDGYLQKGLEEIRKKNPR